MYKFIAKLEVTKPGEQNTKKEELVFGMSNAKLKGLNFTQGFTKILFDKLESEKWVNDFITTGMEIQLKLEKYKKEKYKVKFEQVVEEVQDF